MPLCGQANVATSSTRAPSALPSRLKPEVEVLSLRLTTHSGGGSTKQLRGDGHRGLQRIFTVTGVVDTVEQYSHLSVPLQGH